MAQRYHTRPSTLAGETDPQHAFWLDEAAAMAANAIDKTEQPAKAEPERGIKGVPTQAQAPTPGVYPKEMLVKDDGVLHGEIPFIGRSAPAS